MKTLKRIIPVVVVVLVLAVGAMSALAATRFQGFYVDLPPGGGHITVCSDTKTSTTSYATLGVGTEDNNPFVAWIDGSDGQATDSIKCYPGSTTLSYSRYIPAVNSSVSLRASTTGFFTAGMWISGNIEFN